VPEQGFDGALEFGAKPALVVIDFVKAYVTPGSPLCADFESARLACIELLASARAAAIPVFHTNVSYQPGGRDGGVFFRKLPALRVFEQGVSPELTGFVAGLEPRPGEAVLTKRYASAFFGTPLDALLRERGVDTLIISGVSTSGCIRATAVDSCQYGFVPLVVREAVGDRAQGPHDANLFDLQAKYAEVVTLDRVKRYLERLRSATPTRGP
jgi:nicotinamidase-related amidase